MLLCSSRYVIEYGYRIYDIEYGAHTMMIARCTNKSSSKVRYIAFDTFLTYDTVIYMIQYAL